MASTSRVVMSAWMISIIGCLVRGAESQRALYIRLPAPGRLNEEPFAQLHQPLVLRRARLFEDRAHLLRELRLAPVIARRGLGGPRLADPGRLEQCLGGR